MVKKSRKGREEWKIYNNVFDAHANKTIRDLISKNYFDELVMPIALGKEANVFLASKGEGYVVVKIYRLENCNFNNMFNYIKGDPRFVGLENQKRKVVFAWTQREYRNLMIAREKINVPTPIGFRDNFIIMEYIGEEEPAPQLKNSHPDDIKKFYDMTLNNIILLLDSGIVHGDLSEFNILNYKEEPIFIDFSQGTTIKDSGARELLERDLKNVQRFFKKIGLKTDFETDSNKVINHFDSISIK